jgi:hypothetical protein
MVDDVLIGVPAGRQQLKPARGDGGGGRDLMRHVLKAEITG